MPMSSDYKYLQFLYFNIFWILKQIFFCFLFCFYIMKQCMHVLYRINRL